MRKGLLLPALLALGLPAAHATDVSGTLATDTTFDLAGSPWHVTGNLTVAGGATLTVDPGVELVFDGNYDLLVQGALAVAGQPASPVQIRAETGQTWRSIRIASGSAGSEIGWATISGGGSNSTYGAIRVDGADLSLHDSDILDSANDGLVLGAGADLAVSALSVSGTRYPVHLTSADLVFDVQGATTLAGNQFDRVNCSFSSVGSDFLAEAVDVAWYFQYSVTVQSGATLTLGEGLALKLPWSGSIEVAGALRSLGTAPAPVWITSYADDNIAGDTNGDGSATSPAPGQWNRIRFQDGSDDAACLLRHTNVRFGSSAILCENAAPTFEDCSFTNSHWPVHLTGTSAPTITGCSFAVATYCPIYMSLSANPTMTGNDFSTSNNGYDAIAIIGETLAADGHLPVRDFTGVPNVTYVLWGGITVPAGLTLTIDPGVVIKWKSYADGIAVSGGIVAEGTSEAPIVMTSVKDDNYGNPADTNNDGSITSPAAGDWRGVGLLEGASGSFAWMDVRFAGGYWHWSEDGYYRSAGLAADLCSPTVDHCTFESNSEHGLLLFGTGSASVTNSVFRNHTETPIALSCAATPTFDGNVFENNAYTALGLLGERLGLSCTLPQRTVAGFANIVYLLEELLVVESGSQLSFGPGLVVKALNANCGIDVEGGLDAVGTEEDPVVFTSAKDDEWGSPADTNNDSNGTLPAASNWRHINFLPTADDGNCELTHCYLAWGGYWQDGVVRCENSAPLVQQTTIHGGQFGVSVRGNSATVIDRCTIENCVSTPVYMAVTSNPTISFDNEFSNNGYFALGIVSEPLHVPATLPQRDVAGVENFTYLFLTDFTVEEDGALTMDEGVVAKFLTYADIHVHGSFDIQGTAENRVHLTSLLDDSVGGDTNDDGSGTSPAAGNWGRVYFHTGADDGSTLEHAVIRFGGYDYTTLGQVQIDDCSPTVTDCEITNSYWAFELRGDTQATISDNVLVNLTYAPVLLSLHADPQFSGNQFFNVGMQALQLRAETISIDRTLLPRNFAGIENISYTLAGAIGVSSTTTVTIGPGVTIKSQNGSIDVDGTLVIESSTLTSLRDDTVGNPLDTEDNGSGTVPAAGNWGGIDFEDVSVDAECRISNSTIRFATNGVECANAAPTVENTLIDSCTFDVFLNGNSPATLENVTLSGAATAPVQQSLVTDADYSAVVFGAGNRWNGIHVKNETLAQNVTMRQEACANVDNLPWLLQGLTVGSSSILVVEPGVVVKTLPSAALHVHKGLQAVGGPTPDQQIVFTYVEDDFYGGDTNGDGSATEPTVGESSFTLYFDSDSWDALCTLQHAVFAYGGWSSARGVVEAQSSSPTITDCSFRANRTGVSCVGSASPVLSGCDFGGHQYNAVYNPNPAIVVSAENCWWGHDTGPLDASDDTADGGLYNPGGLGDAVTDHVDYDPWESAIQLPLLGDVSLNGEIRAFDASLILAWLADPGANPLAPEQLAVADVTAEGGVNSVDAHYILQYVVGATTTFPGELSDYPGEPFDPESELISSVEPGEDGAWILRLRLAGENVLRGFQLEAGHDPERFAIDEVRLGDGVQGSLRWSVDDAGDLRLATALATPLESDLVIELIVFGDSPDADDLELESFTVNDERFELGTVAVGEELRPAAFVLHPAAPNPFNPSTRVRFDLPEAENLRATVYNLRGQTVRVLASGRFDAGSHALVWDGTEDSGLAAASGLYLLRLEGERHQATLRMTLLK